MSAVLFYTIGLPGAGKTTFAQNLAKQLSIDHIYGDKIGYELFTHPKFTSDEIQLVRQTMERRVIQGLKNGRSVVYDAMLHSRASRQQLASIAWSHHLAAVGIWIHTPEATARRRANTIRIADFSKAYKRQVPPAVFNRHLQLLEVPAPPETTVQIWGTAPFNMQYAVLRTWLRNMKISPW